jgi:hypothetical protein
MHYMHAIDSGAAGASRKRKTVFAEALSAAPAQTVPFS